MAHPTNLRFPALHAQPVGYQPGTGRFLRRQRRSRGGGRRSSLAGHGYRRFHPPASRFLRRGGGQAHLWAGLALRADRLWLIAGLPRPAGAQGDRCGADAEGDCRSRPARQHGSQYAGARLPAGLEESIRGMRIGLSPDYFRITYLDAADRRAAASSPSRRRSKTP